VIVDLHSHYPMHLRPEGEREVLQLVCSPGGRWRLLDRVRSALVRLASRFGNYASFESGPRVTMPLLRSGGVGVALSVLYSPFDEMDLSKHYAEPPDATYFPSLIRQLEDVEAEVAREFAGTARIAHNPGELDAALATGEVALIHCVEGGFHLGATPDEIDRNVIELARRGAAYVILAHLFWRRIATNANAIPFLPDPLYNLLFPQRREPGLTDLGQAAVEAMVRERVLIDLSHMNQRALDEAFTLLDTIDPAGETPVLASHVAYRFGRQDYDASTETIQRIAARDGVVGLILAEHQAADGLRRTRTKTLDDSVAVLFAHIDRIAEITGSHRHTAIGTDLDGFIKPTLAGLDDAGRLALLERALVDRYGPADAELICSANALRLLRGHWRGAP
jgi:microsomal dipeptidase-like Zn-dependent dipeptidase